MVWEEECGRGNGAGIEVSKSEANSRASEGVGDIVGQNHDGSASTFTGVTVKATRTSIGATSVLFDEVFRSGYLAR
jgi:hypothetical protein